MKGPLTFKDVSLVNLPLEVDSELKKGFRACDCHPPLYVLTGCLMNAYSRHHRGPTDSPFLLSRASIPLSHAVLQEKLSRLPDLVWALVDP